VHPNKCKENVSQKRQKRETDFRIELSLYGARPGSAKATWYHERFKKESENSVKNRETPKFFAFACPRKDDIGVRRSNMHFTNRSQSATKYGSFGRVTRSDFLQFARNDLHFYHYDRWQAPF
jgi:hypothetical protein